MSKSETSLEKHGGFLTAQVLKAHGVNFLFTLCGGHISPILVGAKKIGIQVIDVRHEATAVFAADAMSRLSGICGVAVVTAGPGVTNTVTAMKNAFMAQSPLILIGGSAPHLLKGRGALQDIDHISLLKATSKKAYMCRYVRDIVPTLREAFKKATCGVPGPVFVELAIDILYPEKEVRRGFSLDGASQLQSSQSSQNTNGKKSFSIKKRVTQWFLERHVRRLFKSAFVNQNYAPLPTSQIKTDSNSLKKLIKMLESAKRPLLLIGSQALANPNMADELAAAIHTLNIPCFLSGMARGLLGKDSKIHIRQKRSLALKKADLVILAGVSIDFRLNYGRSLPKKAKIIAINRSSKELKQNCDLFWSPALALKQDPGSFLIELAHPSYQTQKPAWPTWLDELKTTDKLQDKTNQKKALAVSAGGINPLLLCHSVDEVLPDNSILVADGGDFVATASYMIRPRGPLRWLDAGPFGALGAGSGFALAAKLLHPDKEVWVFFGDGSFGFSLAELDTFKRHGLGIITLVGNNASWTQIAREQVSIFGDDVATKLTKTDYHVVSEGFGAKGLCVTESTREQLLSVLKNAREHANSGSPVCINANMGESDFRDGSISM